MTALHPDVQLGVTLSTICGRNRYTTTPGPVIDELLTTAGDRTDILAEEVGTWIGYYEDEHTRTLTTALRELPFDMDRWIELGRSRRGAAHSTQGF